MICYCRVPKGKPVNGDFIIDVLKRFLKVFQKKRREMAANKWFLEWDNAPVHMALNFQVFLEDRNINVLQ